MPDPTPATTDRTVVVQRHGVLTYLSLAFNALILLLILGAMIHHHHMRQEHGGGDGRGGPHGWACHDGDRPGDNREDFHHDGGFDPMRHGWGRHEGFDARDGGGECPMGGPGGDHHDFGMENDHGGWGGGHPAFGGPGMMGGGPDMGGPGMGGDHFMGKKPPSAEEMTDRFMLMLAPKLALTDAENAQIRPIVMGGIQQFQKDMETQKQAHQKMIEDAKTKIRAVLTPDQQKQFDELTASMGGPPAPPAPPAGK